MNAACVFSFCFVRYIHLNVFVSCLCLCVCYMLKRDRKRIYEVEAFMPFECQLKFNEANKHERILTGYQLCDIIFYHLKLYAKQYVHTSRYSVHSMYYVMHTL